MLVLRYFWWCMLLSVMRISESREFYIDGDRSTKYLYYKITDIDEEIVPNDIAITVSISKFDGTLLYSMDRNMNQIIIILFDAAPYQLTVEVNKQRFSVLLTDLCGCEWCRYERLELRLQINKHINLQCNRRDIQSVRKTISRNLNDQYPIMFNTTNTTITSKNEAHVFLVNNHIINIGGKTWYPNPSQMSGCIFNVEFLDMTPSSHVTNIINGICKKTCVEGICNGGQCYETYGGAPICNCTKTFHNGQFCNDSLVTKNFMTKDSHLKLNMIKLSWRSSVYEILKMNNSNIEIYIKREESNLFFSYIYGILTKMESKVTLSNQYKPNREYVCIIQINKDNFDIRTFNNGSWHYIMVPIIRDLNKEFISSVSLRSGSGVIDFVTKDINDYQWNVIDMTTFVLLANETIPRNVSSTKNSGGSKSLTTVVTVSIIVPMIIIPIVALMAYYLRKSKRKDYKMLETQSRRNRDWVTREGVLNDENYISMLNDYEAASENSKLIKCLRDLNKNNYQTIYTEEERINCLALINGIINHFNSIQEEIYGEMKAQRSLGQVYTWMTSCYTLSVVFLAKIPDDESSKKLLSVLMLSLEDLSFHVTNNVNVKSVVETFLVAICNLLRYDGLDIQDTIGSQWMDYFNITDHKMIKFLSAFVITCFYNRNKISKDLDPYIARVVKYVQEVFIKTRNEKLKSYNGFVVGSKQISELESALAKVTREGVLNDENNRSMLNDYEAASMNSKLIECLRKLYKNNYQLIYTEEERINCLALINGIINHFNSKRQEEIYGEMIAQRSLMHVYDWMTSCYTLSVAFLAKIPDDESSKKLLSVLMLSLEDLRFHVSNNVKVKSVVEIFLFAICNLLRYDRLDIQDIIGSQWMDYFNITDHKIIKFLSAFVITCFYNRNKVSEDLDPDIARVVRYVQEVFDATTNEKLKSYNGFVVGSKQRSELESALAKLNKVTATSQV